MLCNLGLIDPFKICLTRTNEFRIVYTSNITRKNRSYLQIYILQYEMSSPGPKLLGLPVELRTIIYRYVIGADIDIRPSLDAEDSLQALNSNLSSLKINRQINGEVARDLKCRCSFDTNDLFSTMHFFEYLSTQIIESITEIALCWSSCERENFIDGHFAVNSTWPGCSATVNTPGWTYNGDLSTGTVLGQLFKSTRLSNLKDIYIRAPATLCPTLLVEMEILLRDSRFDSLNYVFFGVDDCFEESDKGIKKTAAQLYTKMMDALDHFDYTRHVNDLRTGGGLGVNFKWSWGNPGNVRDSMGERAVKAVVKMTRA